jgi:hypothetical protein
MINNRELFDNHDNFKELGALANAGALTDNEWTTLEEHLKHCAECRKVCRQYRTLAQDGIPVLAPSYTHSQEEQGWDDTATKERLFARVRTAELQTILDPPPHAPASPQTLSTLSAAANPLRWAALAACVVIVVGFGAYRLGNRSEISAKQAQASVEDRFQKLAAEKEALDELMAARADKLFQLEKQAAQKEQELTGLRAELHAVENYSNELTATNSTAEDKLHFVTRQREALSLQLRDAQQAYKKVETELVNMRAERDTALLRTASLESRIDELSAANRNQERRLEDDEQFLASDRDIREMMGARKLYIADVFDVDSRSHTRKPFGRVFYTQGKSLLFYAFDLDRQTGLKNASAFQAWGEKETPAGEQAQPLSLGILYMDSESNRRWVLRCDDAKQLAEIDAVFVTVEPHGGSQKPTGKPFLYALLRKEANHP